MPYRKNKRNFLFLKNYIFFENQKVIYTPSQVEKIANYLLKKNNLKTVNSKLKN